MSFQRGWLLIAAVAAAVFAASPSGAATYRTSFGVTATVVATCRIVPGQGQACAPRAAGGTAAPTIAPREPLVSFARDPKTGAVTETIEF